MCAIHLKCSVDVMLQVHVGLVQSSNVENFFDTGTGFLLRVGVRVDGIYAAAASSIIIVVILFVALVTSLAICGAFTSLAKSTTISAKFLGL